MSWIVTSGGRTFNLQRPHPHDVCIEEIAHALSMLCRFTGHTRRFYSVAQHSVHVSSLVLPHNALIALLHDATEAYVGDVASPLKALLPEYQRIEQTVWQAIATRFDLDDALPLDVKRADLAMLAAERRDLMPAGGPQWGVLRGVTPPEWTVVPWTQEKARTQFLETFWGITHQDQIGRTHGHPGYY